jgi:hypothetical protein
MALFTEAVKGKKFKCDECKKSFNGEDVILSSAPTNISMELAASAFLFVDKDGIIRGGTKGPDGNLGDQVGHCPLCNFPHLFGFDTV